jgi:hypothetical protein
MDYVFLPESDHWFEASFSIEARRFQAETECSLGFFSRCGSSFALKPLDAVFREWDASATGVGELCSEG